MEKCNVVPIRKRTKKHRHSSIVYLDQEKLRIVFCSLVIRVKSVNEFYGTLKDFVRVNKLHAKTNGKILIMSEMFFPPIYLTDIHRFLLEPMGLKYGRDFLLILEKPCGNKDRTDSSFNIQMRETKESNWLKSIETNAGCFVWAT